MSVALVAACAALFPQAAPVRIVIDGRPRIVTGLHGMPLTSATGGAVGIPHLLKSRDRKGEFAPNEFWRTLVRRSVPTKGRIDWMNPRVVIDLEGGRRIVVDRQGRFVVARATTQTLEGWRGPVRELTGPQAIRMVIETFRLDGG